VLVFGAVGALFFLKDPAERAAADRRAGENPFRGTVERRLPSGGLGSRGAAAANQRSGATFRVPTAAAAGYSESESQAADMSANYRRTFGSILRPLPQSDPGPSLGQEEDDEPRDEPGDRATGRVHKIADGDTLRKLAAAYLGDSERYLEIYELNRSVLASPDLLPIGGSLAIPNRVRASNSGVGSTAASDDEENLPLVPVPAGGLKS